MFFLGKKKKNNQGHNSPNIMPKNITKKENDNSHNT